jgi:hypothetical protein
MEPLTTTIALGAWEFIGKPFAEKARDYCIENILESLPKLWNQLTSLNDDDKEVIKTVIGEIPENIRKNEAEFKKYIVENIKIDNQNRVIYANTYIEKPDRVINTKTYIESIDNTGGTLNITSK